MQSSASNSWNHPSFPLPVPTFQHSVLEETTSAHFVQISDTEIMSNDGYDGGEYLTAVSSTDFARKGVSALGTVTVVVLIFSPISTIVTTSVAVGWHITILL